MPEAKRTREGMPSKELVLAAIERAELHRIRHDDLERHRPRLAQPGVLLATVKEHLGLATGGWTTIQLRPTLQALEDAGLIEQSRVRGSHVWTLTAAGQQRLDITRKAGRLGLLPESPQHRLWREACEIAGARIGEFGERLRQVLDEAIGMLDADEPPDSDAWHALRERLRLACERLEAASYCLNEWPEPDESVPDVPPPLKGGRRSIRRFEKD
jgi:DNA-binding PadR family transcriptional regulator